MLGWGGEGTFLPHPKHFSGSKLSVKATERGAGGGGAQLGTAQPPESKILVQSPPGAPPAQPQRHLQGDEGDESNKPPAERGGLVPPSPPSVGLLVVPGLVLGLGGCEVVLEEGLKVLKGWTLLRLPLPALHHHIVQGWGAAARALHAVPPLHLLQHLPVVHPCKTWDTPSLSASSIGETEAQGGVDGDGRHGGAVPG